MFLLVHNNILGNINLADVANQFVDRKDSRKHSDIFFRIIINTQIPPPPTILVLLRPWEVVQKQSLELSSEKKVFLKIAVLKISRSNL